MWPGEQVRGAAPQSRAVRPNRIHHRYALIADDLTGATDAGAAFALAGFDVEVALSLSALRSTRAQVVAITTNSRHDSPAVARRKVLVASAALRKADRELIYKKMDSTLQGNIVAEVEAARAAGGFTAALVCPANPKQGRVVRHGVLEVRGEDWGSIQARFQAQGLAKSAAAEMPVTLARVRRALNQQMRFVIGDAAHETDLTALVRAVRSFPNRVLLAGSAGMAASLARLLRAGRVRAQALRPPLGDKQKRPGAPGVIRPTLAFCGSQNLVTQEQIAEVVRGGGVGAIPLGAGTVKAIRAALANGQPAIVQVPIHIEPDAVLLERLRSLESVLRERRAGSLLLTGGDTALLICRWLRLRTIALRGEVLPGLAWGVAKGGMADGLVVCTKPGGFGDRSSLREALDHFSFSSSDS